jgi:hypothetical protein
MKRLQLIEWGLIAVGLIFVYKFVDSVFVLFIQFIYEFSDSNLGGSLPVYFLTVIMYGAGLLLLIRNSRKCALFLNGPATDEILPLRINKQSLLQVILIGICAAAALSGITEILLYVFELFREDVSRKGLFGENNGPNKYFFKLQAVKTIVSLVVIYFSKDIAGWFIRKNEPQELVLESQPETGTDVQQ